MTQHSFIDFLVAYGEANPPSLSYTGQADFPAWQELLRGKLVELLGPIAGRVAPEPAITETVQEADHTRHLLQIRVNEFSTLPAYLLVPAGLKPGEKRPGLLVSHGHATYGIDSICGLAGMDEGDNALKAYALSAVRSGYVVIAPAWWGWTGRTGHVPKIGRRDKCNVIQMAASMYGISVLNLHIQDAQAAIDVLAARPEVDAGRIACLGNSYGGRTAMWFSIFDERIKVCVSSGSMNTFRERSQKLSSCGIQYPHGLLRYADVEDLFCLIAPRPLQLQAGEKDPLITPTDRDQIVETVRKAYRQAEAEDKFDYHRHEQGHLLLWPPAEAFLQRHFGEA